MGGCTLTILYSVSCCTTDCPRLGDSKTVVDKTEMPVQGMDGHFRLHPKDSLFAYGCSEARYAVMYTISSSVSFSTAFFINGDQLPCRAPCWKSYSWRARSWATFLRVVG